jgi:cation:H+ antiporter
LIGPLLLFGLGLGLSLAASEVLVTALSRIGGRLGISAGLLGLLVALGADAPEISSAVTASLSGARDVGVGVILGSNLFNLAALLGVSAVIAGRLSFRRELLILDGGVALLATLVVSLLLIAHVSAVASMALMLLVFLPYVGVLATPPREVERLRIPAPLRHRLAILGRLVHPAPGLNRPGASGRAAWWILPAVAAIAAGSYLMVTAALTLGDRWHLPHALLGAVVLAALTSLPNAYAAVRLARDQNGPAVVSEAFNSNTLNLVVGISVPALFLKGALTAADAGMDLLWLLGMTVAAIALGSVRHELGRLSGVVLIAMYLGFLALIVR